MLLSSPSIQLVQDATLQRAASSVQEATSAAAEPAAFTSGHEDDIIKVAYNCTYQECLISIGKAFTNNLDGNFGPRMLYDTYMPTLSTSLQEGPTTASLSLQ